MLDTAYQQLLACSCCFFYSEEEYDLDDIVWARLIFLLGAVVTAGTVGMILQGHWACSRREPFDER